MSEERRLFLSAARQELLHQLMSGWHRRGEALLQIGLSAGFSPEFFWDAGFDVTALDPSLECLEQARAQTGPRVEYRLGSVDRLPFEDGEFDYAVLIHCSPAENRAKPGFVRPGETIQDVLLEARRVASRGIVLLDWNRCSLSGGGMARRSGRSGSGKDAGAENASGRPANLPRRQEGVLPWELYTLVRRRFQGCAITVRSSLLLGESTWPGAGPSIGLGWGAGVRRLLLSANLHPSVIPLGALLGLRVDWISVPFTPVGMLRSAAASLYQKTAPVVDARQGLPRT